MSSKKPRRARPAPKPAPNDAPHAATTQEDARRVQLAGLIAGTVLGRLFRLLSAFVLAIAGVLLIIAWQMAPQRALDAAKYSKFTAAADGRIVESWLAIEWNPADMGDLLRWHAFARASPCAVVEYAGDWGTPSRRAFCGNRFSLREEHALHDIAQMAPGVPFSFVRDARGFIVPEIRMRRSGLEWLSAHPPYSTFMLEQPPPPTALEALKSQVNHPVDAAIASWSAPLPAFPLALDREHPELAMPAAWVESRRSFPARNWLVCVLLAIPGIVIWVQGMSILLRNVPPLARRMLAVVPLLTLPWWSEQFPDALHSVSKDLAAIVTDIVGDIDRTERLLGSEPEDAMLAGGERLVFPLGERAYAATFGRVRFVLPEPPPASADAALAALSARTTAQVRSSSGAVQAELFAQLARDKVNDLRGAGMIFLDAARSALLDASGDPATRSAARHFLSTWVTQPIEEPHPDDPAFRERVRLFSELASLPIPVISIMAGTVVERARRTRQ